MSVQITDEWERVLPSVFDLSGQERQTIVIYGWLLDGRLDVDKLQASWRKLVHKWPVLSARLRNSDKVTDKMSRSIHWEYCIPPATLLDHVLDSDMSLDRPEATRAFLVDNRQGKVEAHYPFIRGADLPQDRPTSIKGAGVTETRPKSRSKEFLMWASNAPLTLSHLFKEDRALVTVKITTFDNATAIGFSLPHVLFDGPGALEPVRAWAKIVNGHEDEVEPLPRFGHDFFRTLAPGGEEAERAAKERQIQGKKGGPEPPFGWFAFSTFDKIRFGLRFVWDLFWTRPEHTMEGREIYVPRAVVARLKADAQAVVSEICAAEDAARDEKTWISTSDVMHAYALQLMCKADAKGRRDATPTVFAFPVNMRYIAPPTGCEPLPEIYTSNGAHAVVTPEHPLGKLAHEYSLGQIALILRKASKEQTSPRAVRDSLIWRLEKAAQGALLTFFRPQVNWYLGTNWRRMAMYDVSFVGAAAQSTTGGGENMVVPGENVGKTLQLYANVIADMPIRNAFNQQADDPAGGIWMSLALAKWQWDLLDLDFRPHVGSKQ
ncbi:hypothetical protein OC845_003441 [Tilletia horrida]|nr:hypothetical protein OC845_003441 [Tilletia horrida]